MLLGSINGPQSHRLHKARPLAARTHSRRPRKDRGGKGMSWKLVLLVLLLVLALQWDDLTYKGPFVGSRNSDVYHRPGCYYAERIKIENRVWFETVGEAEGAGYRRSWIC